MSPDESQCLGCLYIDPTTLPGYDAEVFCWIRASHATDLDGAAGVRIHLRAWIEVHWPSAAARLSRSCDELGNVRGAQSGRMTPSPSPQRRFGTPFWRGWVRRISPAGRARGRARIWRRRPCRIQRVALRRILEADGLGVDDPGDRQAVVQQRQHELAGCSEGQGLAGVEGIRLRPAKASEAKTEIARPGGLVVRRPGLRWTYGPGDARICAGRPDDFHRLVQHDGGLVGSAMALGFEADGVDHRIHGGFADDRGDLLSKAIVLAEVYRNEAHLTKAWPSRGLARTTRRSV